MTTRRFAIDKKGKRLYIGSAVKYKNLICIVEDMKYLTWDKKQYITLVSKRNNNKKIDFVDPSDVLVHYRAK